jgi:RNA polymerase sigma factor (sigma-70 family)
MESNSDEPVNEQRSDEGLAKLAQSGDVESGRLLFERHQPELMGYALYFCREEELAKDVLQQAYLTAWTQFNTFGSPFKFAAWVKRFVDNIAMNWIRAQKSKAKIFGTGDDPEDINNKASENDKTPHDTYCEKDDSEALKKLLPILEERLANLDETHQQIGRIVLEHFWDEKSLSLDDIVKITGIPKSSVRRYLDKIRKIWKAPCAKWGFEPPV